MNTGDILSEYLLLPGQRFSAGENLTPETLGNVWRFFGCHTWGGGLQLASHGSRPETLVTILQCIGQCP